VIESPNDERAHQQNTNVRKIGHFLIQRLHRMMTQTLVVRNTRIEVLVIEAVKKMTRGSF
jgi:hypothetical protein